MTNANDAAKVGERKHQNESEGTITPISDRQLIEGNTDLRKLTIKQTQEPHNMQVNGNSLPF